QPLRWLKAISEYRGTISGGPSFGYGLCVEGIDDRDLKHLDLSSWEVAFNGAEPVRAETMERFVEKFSRCGFRKNAFYPCFGMAEATLFVSGGAREAESTVQTIDLSALAQNN